jgi:hypothetical protein
MNDKKELNADDLLKYYQIDGNPFDDKINPFNDRLAKKTFTSPGFRLVWWNT